MRHVTFEQFTFTPQTLELRAGGQAVTLRPKTAELLRELIDGRERVLAKRELINHIWHTEHVTDQSVFQAMSELRAVLAPLKAIRTFPNRGYQWVLPVTEVTSRRKPLRSLAAAAALASLIGVAGVYLTTNVTQQPVQAGNTVSTTSLPALVAFGEGASALQRGDIVQALEFLQLSVEERPEFIEARLLLAEAHLVNGEALEARQRADNVMSMLSPDNSAYSLIAAMDLLSRADQQLGQMTSALEWATRAADQANTNGYECTAADLHDRVLALVHDSDVVADQLEASPVFASQFAQRMLHTAMTYRADTSFGVNAEAESGQSALTQSPLPAVGITSNDQSDSVDLWLKSASAGVRPAHCERLRGTPSGGLTPFPVMGFPLDGTVVGRLIRPKPLI